MRISDWSSDVCSSDLVPHGTVNITQFRHVSDTLACYRGHAVFDSSQRWRPEAGSACPGSGGASSPARPPRTAATSAPHDGCRRCSKARSEEHTSELQSLVRISYAVFCLKKKNKEDR